MALFPDLERQLDGNETGGSVSLRQGSAEFEYFVARGELSQADNLAHGFSHLAELLTFDPDRSQWQALIGEYLSRASLDTLIPKNEDGGRYYATEALRAWAFAEEGRLHDAIELWIAVHGAKPSVRYLQAWAVPRLEGQGVVEAMPRDLSLQMLATMLNGVPELRLQTARQRAGSERVAAIARRVAATHSGSPELGMMVPGLLRKAGDFEGALAQVDANERESGATWHNAVARGLIHREAGDPEAAEQAFIAALELDPSDISAMLEAGDTFLNIRQWARALAWYEKVLAQQPEHDWAKPSALWCRSKLSDDPAGPDDPHIAGLVELEKQGTWRARSLINQFRRWEGFLPEPSDATANALRSVLQAEERGDSMAIATSAVEAPSNMTAFRLAGMDATISFNSVATPDPREPIADIAFTVWQLDGEVLAPALQPPPPEVAAAVARVAAIAYERDAVWAAASLIPQTIEGLTPEQLLACVVHPPPVPAGPDAPNVLAWLGRVQLAVADALAHLDDDWKPSKRRDALMSLLLGPMDWSTNAAILALSRLSRDEPALAVDIGAAFAELEASRPDAGAVCWEQTLYWCWCDLPHLWDKEREELWSKYQSACESD